MAREIRAAAASFAGGREVTLAAVFMSGDPTPQELALEGVRIPAFDFPEDAARALSHAVRYAHWRARPKGSVVQPADCRPDEAAAIIAEGLAAGAAGSGRARSPRCSTPTGCRSYRRRVVGDAGEAVTAAARDGRARSR